MYRAVMLSLALTFSPAVVLDTNNNNRISAGAGGATSGRRAADAPLSNQSAGALIAQIGDGEALLIGNRRGLRAPASGRLYLGVNDDFLADNSGDFEVVLTAQRR